MCVFMKGVKGVLSYSLTLLFRSVITTRTRGPESLTRRPPNLEDLFLTPSFDTEYYSHWTEDQTGLLRAKCRHQDGIND